jgi:hypothetical protein
MYVFLRENYKALKIRIFVELSSRANSTMFFLDTIFLLTYLVLSGSTGTICKNLIFSDFFVQGNPISNHIQES